METLLGAEVGGVTCFFLDLVGGGAGDVSSGRVTRFFLGLEGVAGVEVSPGGGGVRFFLAILRKLGLREGYLQKKERKLVLLRREGFSQVLLGSLSYLLVTTVTWEDKHR